LILQGVSVFIPIILYGHSSASLLLASGVPLKQIQEWLGYSDFAITANTYAHLDFNSKIDAANAMTWIEKTSIYQLQDINCKNHKIEQNELE